MRKTTWVAAILPALFASVTWGGDIVDWWKVERVAGNATVYSYGESPYNRAIPGLPLDDRNVFSSGSEEFNASWAASAGASSPAEARVGLGPNYNAASCNACHFRDGRGLTQTGAQVLSPLIAKVDGAPHLPLQLYRFEREVIGPRVAITWQEDPKTLHDGTIVMLRKPIAIHKDAPGQPIGLRNAPPVFGLGLVDAIDMEAIARGASRKPFSVQGVTGRVRHVDGPYGRGIGRYGWKAEHVSIEGQVAGALIEEMGVESPTLSATPEISQQAFNSLVSYMRMLGVPARRITMNDKVLLGSRLFDRAGCAICHTPRQRTSERSPFPQLRNQEIFPFTDMLLHNMGKDLADPGGGEWSAYWRTPALWGIGTQERLSAQAGYLHDGRARSLLEAVVWHGGEASASAEAFRRFSASERQALLAFLETL